ncbi:MAG TPA: hypothetical protein VKO63_11965, partial [Chitinispirillaceae bacterium]|nr:hypothetical protein [Chitinispirillaceae bacterium]
MLQKIHIISLFLVTALYAQNADKYEPNNDFSSAYPISFGDSVVVNASVFGTDTVVTDPSLCDIDYYRIALDSGKIVQFYIFPIDYTCFDFNVGMNFQLFDSSKDLVYSDIALRCPVDGMTIPGYGVTKTGTYYLRIRIKKLTNPYNGPATNYGLSVHQRDNKNILTVLSPNGGETFNGGDYVKVKWQHDSTLFTKRDIRVQYSIDNGKSWRNAWYESLFDSVTSNYTDDKWRIPHLKYRTDQALLRVISRDIPNASFGISKGTFTILASKNDMYEPNDDFSTARAITLGDSVVQNGIVMKGYTERDSSIIDTTLTDVDFFRIYLEAGKHVTIKDVFSRGTEEVCWENECDDMFNAPAVISLYDASKNQIGMSSISSLTCGISHSGIYYCKIVPGDGDDYWNRYSLSIHQSDPITIISPKGGEHFQAGQKIQINWTSDSTFWYFNLYFSVNNGISWNLYMNTKSTGVNSSSWVIPAFKNRTDQALIKIEIPNVVNQFSCISKP